MNASIIARAILGFTKRALVISYWLFAAALILTCSGFALGLILMLVLPLIPFLALPFCFMGFALASRPRTILVSPRSEHSSQRVTPTFASSTLP